MGNVAVKRRYYVCRHCRAKQTPWDVWAGMARGHLSPQAKRLAALVGSSWSFDIASARLLELSGIRLSHETIRQVTHAAGAEAQAWLHESESVVEPLRNAEGHVEFYTDGTSVNTRGGWREMRLSVWAKRPAGKPANPSEWATRSLPKPTARWVSGGISTSDVLGPQWAAMARQAGVTEGAGVSVLADGAKWIWKQVAEHLPQSECVVDVFHVSEHLHACGRTLHGNQTPQARQWAEARLTTLLAEGPLTLLHALDSDRLETTDETKQSAVEHLASYLKSNLDGLWYRDRLQRGVPIGSGMVEGACKTVVGRRLKCNSARWTVPNADRMTALCCLHYSGHWDTYWAQQVA